MSEAPDTNTPATGAPADAPAASAETTPPASGGEPTAPSADVTPAPAGADSESGGLAAGTKVEGTPSPDAPVPIDPASYELTVPETFTVNEEQLTEARALFADAGVPKDKAQGLIDLYAKVLTAQQSEAQTQFTTQQSAWMSELNALPELQGATRETSLSAIGRVFDEYGPEAREAFNNPLIGNNPAVVKFMLKVAATLSEGNPSAPGRPANPGKEGRAPKGYGLEYPNTPEIQGNA